MPVQQKKNAVILWSLLFLPFVVVSLLSMPNAFANGRSNIKINKNEAAFQQHVIADSSLSENNNAVASTYEHMHLLDMGLSKQAFEYAMKGFNYLLQQGKLANDKIVSIVDFSLSSSKKRLFVIDLNEQKVLFNTYVAHGVNSGKEFANQFSNNPSSYQSSLGFYETKSTYLGGHGYSLKLEGLEKGINDNANSRDIVIHAADYVSESLIKSQGYIGRSWGCPALPEKLHKPIIDKIKNGSCLFIYSHDNNYLHKSRIINT